MISRAHPFLGWALVISIALHTVVIAVPAWRGKVQSQAPLKVALQKPLAAPAPQNPAPEQPKLILPEKMPAQSPARPSLETLEQPSAAPQTLSGQAARMAGEQMARELLYPVEAVERGLQGEAVVLLFLDESGNAVAARLEESSGHAMLDAAAVRAARTLRSLPSSAPREALLPVRFRLR